MPKRSWELGMVVKVMVQGVEQTGCIVGYEEMYDEYIVKLDTNGQKVQVKASALR